MNKKFLRSLRNAALTVCLTALTLSALGSCSGSSKKPDAHHQWLLSLNDSIAALRLEADSVNRTLAELHNEVGTMLEQFQRVENPRWVEGFSIYAPWASKYPPKTTSLIARFNDSEQLEMIATLKGGNGFESIRATSQGESITSDRVAHDQALNYMQGGLTTVAFIGEKADSIAAFIENHSDSDITIDFLSPSKTVASHRLTAGEKEMIFATSRLMQTHKQAKKLEALLPLINRKIMVFEQKALPAEPAS